LKIPKEVIRKHNGKDRQCHGQKKDNKMRIIDLQNSTQKIKD